MKVFYLCLVFVMFGSLNVQAQLHDDVVGVWQLDREETESNIRQSPKWDEEIERVLPMILTKMEAINYNFTGAVLTVVQGERKQVFDYIVSSDAGANPVVLEMLVDGQTVNLEITFISDNQINIKSSETDDMDYYIWKRVK